MKLLSESIREPSRKPRTLRLILAMAAAVAATTHATKIAIYEAARFDMSVTMPTELILLDTGGVCEEPMQPQPETMQNPALNLQGYIQERMEQLRLGPRYVPPEARVCPLPEQIYLECDPVPYEDALRQHRNMRRIQEHIRRNSEPERI